MWPPQSSIRSLSHGTHQARDPRRVCWLGSGDPERVSWPWLLIPLSAPLEGVLDHVCTSHDLVRYGAALGQDAGAAEELQNQLVGLGGLVALAAGTAVEAGLAVKKARSAG